MNAVTGTGHHAKPGGRRRSVGEQFPVDLIGRQVELSLLAGFITSIEDEGNAVLVRGDPGIGKSHLLRRAAELAADAGWTILTVTGIETDTTPPFAGLHLLLSSMAAEPNAMPAVQQQALATAFGVEHGEPPELFLVALAVLSLLTEKAAVNPVMLVVDDMQWLDSSTNDVLAFVARRISRDPILIIGAVRAGHSGRVFRRRPVGTGTGRLGRGRVATVARRSRPRGPSTIRMRFCVQRPGTRWP